MYITNDSKHYSCMGYGYRDGTAVFSGVEGLELPVDGAVTLCTDEGFELAVQDAGDYVRQTLEGNVLTLTNLPEPEPVPEPLEPQIDDITALQLAVAELAETQAIDQTNNEIALAEIAEMVTGG